MSGPKQNNGDNNDKNAYQEIFNELQSTFETDISKDLTWRKQTLRQTLAMFQGETNITKWNEAFIADLGGGEIRVLIEIGTIIEEIETCLSNLNQWAADRKAALGDPMSELPFLDKRVIRPTPKGVTLTIGAWNFPLNLLFVPMIDAIAAGNVCVLKPSELAPHTAQLALEMVTHYLPKNVVRVVCGGIPETTELLKLPWDHMTVTGSTTVGKIVMKAASNHLTPCTLELGGKSPTYIHTSANINLAADRIILAKSLNAGQWCIDVDYVMVDAAVVDSFVEQVVAAGKRLCGTEEQQKNADGSIAVSNCWYNRLINEQHTKRLMSYLQEDHGGEVILGGLDYVDISAKFFPLTIVLNPNMDTLLMKEEIFGPILVIQTVVDDNAAIQMMKRICNSPLALYVYSNNPQITEKILMRCTSGSVGVNTSGEQAVSNTVPFGGVGQSGFGAYHGKVGFDEYSHLRSILYRTNVLPLMLLPRFMQSHANEFPHWVKPFVEKKFITGFVPVWVKQVFYVVLVAVLASIVVKNVA